MPRRRRSSTRSRAGDVAAAQHAYEEAARHYRSALDVLETEGVGDAGRACELLLGLGEVLSARGRGARVEAGAAARRGARRAGRLARPARARRARATAGRLVWARAEHRSRVGAAARARTGGDRRQRRRRARAAAGTAGSAACRDDPVRDASRGARRRGGEARRARSATRGTLARRARGAVGARSEGPDTADGGAWHVPIELLALAAPDRGPGAGVCGARATALHGRWMGADRAALDVELGRHDSTAGGGAAPARAACGPSGRARTMLALMEGRLRGRRGS